MPELPEVEATRRHLEPVLVGARIAEVEVRRPRMARRQPRPADVRDRMVGRRITALGRRGKFLMAHLDSAMTWITHLGMSGRMSVAERGDPEAPHTNVVVRLRGGTEVRFVDPRTFGFVAVLTPEEMDEMMFRRIGPDALDGLPATVALQRRLEGRTAPIKALLLDQQIVAGIGNIYADEILWRARVAPWRQGGSLTPDEVSALRRAVHPVLKAGLKAGGTSLGDLAYLLPDGRAGEFVSRLAVYGKQDEPCPRCGTPVERTVLRQRSAHWCPSCQS
jgi:formamidopyrimidine-DNA glycosylase